MKYKVGDRVRIKSIDWYNENKDNNREIKFENGIFTTLKSTFLGQIMTIEEITLEKQYILMEDRYKTLWTDEMIEGLVEEETKPKYEDEVNGEYYSTTKYLVRPNGYQFVDENGNVINAMKIVLEKKKKEYPKTFEECVHVLEGDSRMSLEQMNAFRRLIDARNAYWKIAGEEMGLGKPWKPRWNSYQKKWIINFYQDEVNLTNGPNVHFVLAFPTEEMRDAFKENFDPDIEICKELL